MNACMYFSLISGMQIANFMCRIVLSLHPVWLYHILPNHNDTFGKKVIEHKMCVLIFSTNLSETFLIRRRMQPHIIMHLRVVKSRRMRWAGHVARMGEERGANRVLVGKPEGKNHWGDPDVDGKIILRWIFRKSEGVVRTGWSWLRIGRGGGQL